jgi:tetratricopeptide (TPR) repeat protein
MSTARRRALEVGALGALALVLYGPRLGHPFVTDDAIYIVENPAVVQGAPLATYFTDRATVASNPDFQWQSWRPLRTLAFRAVARAGGVHPLPFGLANLGLYLLGAVLVLGLGRRLGVTEGALWGAALWVAAPVHVEPVLYASALGDHLSLVLELGGLWLALDALAGRPRAAARAVAGWLLVAAAMLTKEMAVTAPALLAVLAWLDGAPRKRAAALVAAYAGAALLFLWARTAVGALAQLAMVPWRLGAYLRIVLAPLGHSAAYVLPWPGAAWLALAWVGLAAVAVLLWRVAPPVRAGAAWFAVALAPVLGIVPVFADLADRFALLPSVGLAWAAPFAIAGLARRWRPLGLLAPALLLVTYGAGTAIEGAAWRDEAALWSKAVVLEPGSAQARRNLGLILLQRGDAQAALRHFDEARRLGEQAGELDRRRAMALEALGRYREAEAAAAEAITRDPQLGPAYALYGGLVVRRGAIEEAEHALERARRWAPNNPSTFLLEVEIAEKTGDTGREREALARLTVRYPLEPRFHYRSAVTELRGGDAELAASHVRLCLQLAPGNAQCLCLAGKAAERMGGKASAAEQAACRGVGSP